MRGSAVFLGKFHSHVGKFHSQIPHPPPVFAAHIFEVIGGFPAEVGALFYPEDAATMPSLPMQVPSFLKIRLISTRVFEVIFSTSHTIFQVSLVGQIFFTAFALASLPLAQCKRGEVVLQWRIMAEYGIM